jgi:hypothetical protein
VQPLDFPCVHCRVAAGEKCKNYLGKGKAPCRDRGPARVQMEHAVYQKKAEVKNAKAEAALGPLFAHEAQLTTPEAEWNRWRLAHVGEDRLLKQHMDEFFCLLPVERCVRALVGPEPFAKLDAYRRKTYPTHGYAYGFWLKVLTGERVGFAYKAVADRQPGQPAVACTDWYEQAHMAKEEFYRRFPYTDPPALPQHQEEAELIAYLDALFARFKKGE